MENLLPNEQYSITRECKNCGIKYNDKKLGCMVNVEKFFCDRCKLQTEVIKIVPVRQILME